MIHRLALSVLSALCLLPVVLHAAGAAGSRPNIVIILADDMGFSDIGCYGSEIHTPNLDALAAGGLRFTQFYNTGRCCPTRAALQTGLTSHQAGVGHMTGDDGLPGYRGHLHARCVTIAEALRPAGYRSYAVGKWHVGGTPEYWPQARGYARYYGANSAAGHYFGIQQGRRFIVDNREWQPTTALRRVGAAAYYPLRNADGTAWYGTDAYTDWALRFLREHDAAAGPFFLYVAYTAPHWPLHAWPQDIARYRGRYRDGWDALRRRRHARMIELGIVDANWPLTPRDEGVTAWADVNETQRDAMDLRMAVYAAMIDRMDQNIGRLVAGLQAQGVLDNTLILFLSDNGGCAEGGPWGFSRNDAEPGTPDSYASYGLSWANASNTPFRRYKHWTHEGGIATPLIAHWPRVIRRGGGLTDQVGHVVDLMATCLDVAGTPYPATRAGRRIEPLAGQSLLPVFETGRRVGHDHLFWEHEGNRAVRAGTWKLVSQYPGDWELYDLQADRTELHNLVDTHPDVAQRLQAAYRDWAERTHVRDWGELKRLRKANRAKAKR